MELSNIFLLLLLFIPFIYLCLHKLKPLRTQPGNINVARSFKLPPGSGGFATVGETLSYYLSVRAGCQYEFVKERMDKFSSKIFRTSLFGYQVAMFCDAEGNKFLFSNENKLFSVWWPSRMEKLFPKSDNQPTGEHAKRLHKIIVPLIRKVDVLREYLGVMDALMKQHLEKHWDSKNVVIVGEMARKYTLTLGCNIVLGINDTGNNIDELEQRMDEIEAAFLGMPGNLPGTALSRGIKASKIIRAKVEAIIRQRKMYLSTKRGSSCSSVKDFMSHLLLEADENGKFLKEEDIASHLVGLVLAGYTSLHSTITMVMKILAEHPLVYDSVFKEQEEIASLRESRGGGLIWEDIRRMKYTWNVVCEVLRLYTPGVGGFREAITDFTHGGYAVPKGWKIHWVSQTTHKSPKYFRDPGSFDPSRFDGEGPIPYTFIPFGAGARMCPGNEYARLAILTFMHRVVTEFRWEKTDPGEKLLQFPYPRPVQGLPVRLYPHKV